MGKLQLWGLNSSYRRAQATGKRKHVRLWFRLWASCNGVAADAPALYWLRAVQAP